MNILYYFWNENSAQDIEQTFLQSGHKYVKISYPLANYDSDPVFESQLEPLLRQSSFDCIFTFNYLPILSKIANQHGIVYASWIYDCPNLTLYSHTIANPCNYLFLFDRNLCRLACSLGAVHAYHLPLAVNARRLNEQLGLDGGRPPISYDYDVSFVGSLYDTNPYDQIAYLPDRLRGYYDGVMRAQREIWGAHFVPDVIPDDILNESLSYILLERNTNYAFSPRDIIATMLDQKIASTERIHLLNQIAAICPPDIFTGSQTSSITGGTTHGYISYTEEMPRVFFHSKINLNITLRSITSGIPLRCLDIMGSQGFLLTNYQPELFEFFAPGEDFAWYESEDDLMAKIEYYLAHEEERQEIARNGWQKIQSCFSYDKKLDELLNRLPSQGSSA